ncbi:MAG TPA: alpha/beta fold hydrolase [Chloroflexota bacterium]|nr:alpha/beta fold hydrolase [Chloroflexota bacterium]
MTGRTTAHEAAAPGRLPQGRVLVIPGLDGDPRLLMAAAPRLFPGLRALPFDHLRDAAEDGVEGLAARALRVLDADPAGAAPAYVCGESFGGTIALTLARRHPERVRGLLLLSAFARYPGASAHASRLGMACWRLLGDPLAARVFHLWRPIGAAGALGRRPPRALVRAYCARPQLHLPGYRAKAAIALHFDARPWLGAITCPAFVLIGTRDPVVPPSAGRELACRLPHARLYCLPGGHLVHIVHAGETGALIARWRSEQEGDQAAGDAGDAEHSALAAPAWRASRQPHHSRV